MQREREKLLQSWLLRSLVLDTDLPHLRQGLTSLCLVVQHSPTVPCANLAVFMLCLGLACFRLASIEFCQVWLHEVQYPAADGSSIAAIRDCSTGDGGISSAARTQSDGSSRAEAQKLPGCLGEVRSQVKGNPFEYGVYWANWAENITGIALTACDARSRPQEAINPRTRNVLLIRPHRLLLHLHRANPNLSTSRREAPCSLPMSARPLCASHCRIGLILPSLSLARPLHASVMYAMS